MYQGKFHCSAHIKVHSIPVEALNGLCESGFADGYLPFFRAKYKFISVLQVGACLSGSTDKYALPDAYSMTGGFAISGAGILTINYQESG